VNYMFSELFPSALDNIQVMENGHHVGLLELVYRNTLMHIPDRGWAAFSYSLSIALICFIPAVILYRKKIFIKL
jgi:predicted acyltransferase